MATSNHCHKVWSLYSNLKHFVHRKPISHIYRSFLPMKISGNHTQQTPISGLFHLRKSGIWLPCMSFSVFNSSQPVNWKMWVEASWRLKMLCRFKVTWPLLKIFLLWRKPAAPYRIPCGENNRYGKVWIYSKFMFWTHKYSTFCCCAFSGNDL